MAAAQAAETMKMSEAWPDTYDEGYIHKFQPETAHKIPYINSSLKLLTKFTSSSKSTEFKDILP